MSENLTTYSAFHFSSSIYLDAHKITDKYQPAFSFFLQPYTTCNLKFCQSCLGRFGTAANYTPEPLTGNTPTPEGWLWSILSMIGCHAFHIDSFGVEISIPVHQGQAHALWS